MSISLLLPATPPTTTHLDNPYTPNPSTRPWPRAPSDADLASFLPAKRDALLLLHPPTPTPTPADADAWTAAPVDASSPSARPGARGRPAGGARKGGGGARGGGRRQGGRGGRKAFGGGDRGDGDGDGDDDRERKEKGGAGDPIDVPSDDEDDESEDEETPPPRGGEASGLATPPSTGVEGRGEVVADRPPARFFGTFTRRREGLREPPPTRRPGRALPVPREEREAPWGETWWADRAASFDFGETIFATAYQSLQITADLLRNEEGKRPKMAPPSTLPWQSRFGLPQPEDMPSMKAFEKELDGKGVWDLKGPLPELFEGKDGKEVDPLTVFPLHGDVNLPTPPPRIEDTTKRTKGKQRAST